MNNLFTDNNLKSHYNSYYHQLYNLNLKSTTHFITRMNELHLNFHNLIILVCLFSKHQQVGFVV